MKRTLSWWVLLILSVIGYGLKYVIGGAMGDVLGLFGLLMILFAIIAGVRELRSNQALKSKLSANKNYILTGVIILVLILAGLGIAYANNRSTIEAEKNPLPTLANEPVTNKEVVLLNPSQEQSLRLQAKARGYSPECVETFIEFAKEKSAKEQGVTYQRKDGLPSDYECSHAKEITIQKIVDEIVKANPEKEITYNEDDDINRNLPSGITSSDIKDKLLALGFKYLRFDIRDR